MLKPIKNRIASRQDRQMFWLSVLTDKDQREVHRIKAVELLGKSLFMYKLDTLKNG